jgi:signal transduction histidine kinase
MKELAPFGFVCCDLLHDELTRCLARLGLPDAPQRVFDTACHLPRSKSPYPDVLVTELLGEADRVVALCAACCADSDRHNGRVIRVDMATPGELFLGRDALEALSRAGTWIVLPGWVTRWRSIVVEDWGFDPESARDFFAETNDRMLLLDTGRPEPLDQQLAELSSYSGLPMKRRFVGVDHLEALLARVIERARWQTERARLEAQARKSRAVAAEHAAVADFVTSLGKLPTEHDVIERLVDTCNLLFAPEDVRFAVAEGPDEGPRDELTSTGRPDACLAWRDDSGRALTVRIRYHDQHFGRLLIEGIAFPEHTDRYVTMARVLGEASAMAMNVARLVRRERQLVRDLEEKVEDLDAFAYVVSHDLKEPLRAIRGYATILDEDHASELSEGAAQDLRAICHASDRMKGLIDDLLKLSRISHKEMPVEQVDLNLLLDEVLDTLDARIQERGIQVSVQDLPPVFGCATWLREAFHNLITNAAKYNDEDVPCVTVGQALIEAPDPADGPPMVVVFVRDNGLGIDERYHERIFEVFQRLESRKQGSGSGAGLAIVKKIIERSGGRIWLESRPGEGTTFYFTLHLAEVVSETERRR